jgi:hypothetical protein
MKNLLTSFGAIILIGVLASSNINLNQFFGFMESVIKFLATIVVGIFQIFITIIEAIL